MPRLQFGGPGLPEGSVTWYNHVNPDGTIVHTVRIGPGATIDEARVADAQDYIDRGLATRVAADAAIAAEGD